jgi:hypothetical protein
MQKYFFYLLIFLLFIVSSYAVNIEGNIDVYPAGFIIDRATPFAIHFSCWTTSFLSNSMATAKLRIFSDSTTIINYTWSTAGGILTWREDEHPNSSQNPIPVSNSTVSGWLFGMGRSLTYFGLSTCKIRVYNPKTSIPYDLTTSVLIYAWNTTTDAGWIEGIFPQVGANSIVLAKDSTGKILGSYITEDNQISEPIAYPTTTGYFKLGVPVGKIAALEFRNSNNQNIATYFGPWTIFAGKVTNIGTPTNIEIIQWSKY